MRLSVPLPHHGLMFRTPAAHFNPIFTQVPAIIVVTVGTNEAMVVTAAFTGHAVFTLTAGLMVMSTTAIATDQDAGIAASTAETFPTAGFDISDMAK